MIGPRTHTRAHRPSLAQLLVRWSLHRGCGAIVSTSNATRVNELLSAPKIAVPVSALGLLDAIPVERHRRRVVPEPFRFLFDDG